MSIPYHLRAHKYVDRALFIDLLHRLDTWSNKISSYEYIGFGGSFLDDFRLLHHAFGFEKMISVEELQSIYDRQLFNIPSSCVKCVFNTMDAFLNMHDFQAESILWLDYESPKNYEAQLDEAQTALSKMDEGDIFRITFNIDPKTLKADGPKYARKSEDEKAIRRKQVLCGKLGKHKPLHELDMSIFQHPCDISPILIERLQACAEEARRPKRAKFHHLMSTKYCDSAPMLTVTGIITKDIAQIRSTPALASSSFVTFDRFEIVEIDIPVLSAPERLLLDPHLPAPNASSLKAIGLQLTDAEYDGLLRFYRFLPHFQRVSILV